MLGQAWHKEAGPSHFTDGRRGPEPPLGSARLRGMAVTYARCLLGPSVAPLHSP
jgi:hypothetical protein